MIKYASCLIARGTDPYRNLAIEKHLMDTLPDDTVVLYLWQNERTIVIGRNQDPWNECRVTEFQQAGGRIARRLSGGGAVYHDLGNLNFTFILPKSQFNIPVQLSVVALAVGAFGVRAEQSGRNDLLANGRKFNGNAFYKSGRAAYHHGTLLVASDTERMARYLTVDDDKLQSNAVRSVPSRVVNLHELCPDVSVESLQTTLYQAFWRVYGCAPTLLDEQMLDPHSLSDIAAQFADEAWVFPREEPYSFVVRERFPWGGVTVKLQTEGGVIRRARLHTDAMEAGLFPYIEAALTGSPFLISAISGRVQQKLVFLSDPLLLQMAGDVCALICGRMRDIDRSGGGSLARAEEGAAE